MRKIESFITDLIEQKNKVQDKSSHKKDKIMQTGVIFLVCMLLLTVFSNSIQTMLLPQVIVAKPKEGMIYKKVRGNGQLESNKTHIIYADSDKKIDEILVQVGDTVSQNQVLIRCEGIENEEMKAEADALENMELEYQKKLLEVSDEYGVNNLIIADARAQLMTAIETRDQAASANTSIMNLKNQIESKSEERKELEKKYQDTQKELGDRVLIDITEIEERIKEEKRELEVLKEEQKDLQAALETAGMEGNQEKIINLERDIRDVNSKITNKEADIQADEANLKQAKKENRAVQKLIDANETAKEEYESCQNEISDLEEEKQQLEAEYGSLENAQFDVSQKEIALKELLLREKQDALDFEQSKTQLEEQEKLVKEKYQAISSNEIASQVAGIVSEIHCLESQNVTKEQPVITIKQIAQGYLLKLEVDKKEAEYVKIGDKAQILNIWNEEVAAYVSNIRASAEDPDKYRVIEFTVEGENLAIGQNVAVSVGEMQEYYDLIIPLNAVYEDNQGQFVFVLKETTTPLGSRYYVERRSVEVLMSDDSNAAVISDFSVQDYVVTQTMEPLENYGKVRLVE